MREHELYVPLLRGAEQEGWALYRISDLAPGRKPFDIGGISPTGKAVGLEVKCWGQIDWHKPLPWQKFESSQRGWLKRYAALGGLAIIVLVDKQEPLLARAIRLLPSDFTEGSNRPPLAGHRYLRALTLNPARGAYAGWHQLLL